jgi:hypothetical protein
MAYSNSPENSTYKTVDMEFTATAWPRTPTSTSAARDPYIFNMYYERVSNENQTSDFVLVKRPGFTDTTIDLQNSSGSSLVNGYYYDVTSAIYYWAVGNNVYSRTSAGTITNIATMASTNSGYIRSVAFTTFLTSTGTRYLCFTNGAELWYHVIGSGTSTKVTDADFPAPIAKSLVFLDGYLFVIKADTGDIYNSSLDTPINWVAGNYITAEINPDRMLAIAKTKNYLVAFGRDGIEFFYNAANENGSPLGRNESYYQPIGLNSTVETIGENLFFVGRRTGQSARVYLLNGNQVKEISPPWVNRYIENYTTDTTLADGLTNVHPFSCSINGKDFVLLCIIDLILAYDVDTGFWYRWQTNSSTNSKIQAVWPTLPGQDQYPIFSLYGKTYASALSPIVYQDFGFNFDAIYITGEVTADTFNWKTCHRFGLHCDYPTTLATSNVQISWTDDDGQTWASSRNLSVTTNNPYITQLGRFRTRNWKITYTDNYPFRMWGCSMDLNVGAI